MNLYKACLALWFAVIGGVFAYDYPALQGEIKTNVSQDNSKIMLNDGKRLFGALTCTNKTGADLLHAKIAEGYLTIDTRDFYQKYPNARINLTFTPLPNNELKTSHNAKISLNVGITPEGEGVAMGLAGTRGDGKSWWKRPIPLLAESTPEEKKLSLFIPDYMKQIKPLVYLLRPAVYRFGMPTITLSKPEEIVAETVPAGDQVINGGIEHGFYSIYRPDIRRLGNAYDGKYFGAFGDVLDKDNCMKVFLDNQIVHGGKYSLRLEKNGKTIYDRLCFNSIKYFPGRPLTYSVWVKAEKEVSGELWLHPSSGARYVRKFTAGPEWQKVTLTVPNWGKPVKSKNVLTIGDMNKGIGYVDPQIVLSGENAKLWVDDARCEYGVSTPDAPVIPAVRLYGGQERSFIYAGEKIEVTLNAEADVPGKAELVWEIRDIYGVTVKEEKTAVTLPLKQKLAVTPPANLRGPVTLCVAVILPDDRREQINFLSGIIDKVEKKHPYFGVNVFSHVLHNAEICARLLKAFRISCVRLWSSGEYIKHHPQYDTSRIYKKHGMYVLNNLSRMAPDSEHRFLFPADSTEYLHNLEQYVTNQTKGYVDAYEIFNEPNAWTGRKNSDPQKYLPPDMPTVLTKAREVSELLHKLDPQAKIAGPATCHTRVPWIKTYLDNGGKDFIDIITEHPYRYRPELPDYADDLRAIKTFKNPQGQAYPIFSSESGSLIPMNQPANLITPDLVKRTAADLRLALIGLVGGLDKYFHFRSGGGICCCDYSNFQISEFTDDYAGWVPSTFLYAFKAAADILENAKFVTQPKIGIRSRCYIFDRGDKRIAAIWKWEGSPATIKLPAEVEYADLVGTRRHGSSFQLNENPVYIISDLSADRLADFIRRAAIPTSGDVIAVTSTITGKDACTLKVRNLSGKNLSGTIKLTAPATGEYKFADIPPEQAYAVLVTLPQPVSMTPQPLKGECVITGGGSKAFALEAKGILVPHIPRAMQFRGELNDWENAVSLPLSFKNAITTGKASWTDAEKKITADVKLQWNDEALYIGVLVHKDQFHPENRFGTDGIWKGDGLQIAFDSTLNAQSDTTGYQDDDFEYAASLFNGEPLVVRKFASSPLYDSLFKAVGKINEVPFKVTVKDKTILYELAFQSSSISPFKLENNSAAGFSLIINVGNGTERRGWLELTPGLGQQPKRPGKFTQIILSK